jgi:uncharacterized protein YjiS (DUF1127 family)
MNSFTKAAGVPIFVQCNKSLHVGGDEDMRAEFETRPNLEQGFGPVDGKAVDEAIARARRLRAEAFAEHASRAGRAVAGWLGWLIGAARPMRRRRADTRALMRLDDRLLADIGLRRSDIKAAIYGDVPLGVARQEQPERPAPARPPAGGRPAPGAPEHELDRAA